MSTQPFIVQDGIKLTNGSSITGDINQGVSLTTDRGTIRLGNNPELIGGATHFHVMKDAYAPTDLYFGDDYNYVLQRGPEYNGAPGYGVEIGTNDWNGGGFKSWRFGTDGILTTAGTISIAPGGRVITDGSTGITAHHWNNYPNGTTNWFARFYASTGTNLKARLGLENLSDITIETTNNADGIGSTGTDYKWTFGGNGNLTLPVGGEINSAAGTGAVVINSNDGATTSTWTFGTSGTLTFPDATAQTTAWNDANFMAAMLAYDGAIVTNTATIGVGGLTVNGPVTFNSSFSFLGTATTISSNSGTFYGDVYGVGALYAGVAGATQLPDTVFQASANHNAYIQNNFQNINNGVQASTEWVATADNGNDSNHYLDMGIAGSAWDGSQSNSVGTAASANDSWVYAQGSTSTSAGGNLILGTIKNGKSVKILTGSTGSSSIVATFNGRNINATTTNSGSLQVVGGVGISQNLYAGTVYSNDGTFRGPSGFGSITLSNGGLVQLNSLLLNVGNINAPGNFASMTLGGAGGTGSVKFYSTASIAGTTAATSTTTGALIVSGGAGISGNAYVGGYVVQQALPAFRVIGNGGAISGTALVQTTITGTNWTMDYNQGSYLNASTGFFTAPVAGIYQVNLTARTNSNSLNAITQCIIVKTLSGTSSTSISLMLEWAPNTTMNHAGASTAIKLAVGDTLKFNVSGGTISFDSNDSWSVAFLG